MSTMTDREMLKLAAKAAGYSGKVYSFPGMDIRHGLTQAIYIEELDAHWNPLESDGDALRLAVKLGLRIETPGCARTFAVARTEGANWQEFRASSCGSDDEATRLAITRAAAEIGRSMK